MPNMSGNGDSPSGTLQRRRFSRTVQGVPDQSYRVEDGTETSVTTDRGAYQGNIILENPETETRWYFRYFLTKFHQNFVAFLPGNGGEEMEPVMLSVLSDTDGRSKRFNKILFKELMPGDAR